MKGAICIGKPPDWWETTSEGARLALALCSICPARTGCADDQEYGVIRAGVAWHNTGVPAGLCGCGYPLPLNKHGDERSACLRCDPPSNVRYAGGRAADVARLVGEGLSYAAVGKRLGISKSMVGKYVRRGRRPQAVSTAVGAS